MGLDMLGLPMSVCVVIAAMLGAYAVGLAVIARLASSPRVADAGLMTAAAGAVVFGVGMALTGGGVWI